MFSDCKAANQPINKENGSKRQPNYRQHRQFCNLNNVNLIKSFDACGV